MTLMESTSTEYQLLPPLPSDDYLVLKADIAKRGVLVPVEVDEQGHILDGHHRVQAWTELRAEGVKVQDYDRLVRANLTEPEKRNHVRALNLLRRHLGKDQLREQMVQMRQDGATLAEIAKATGVVTQTVANTLNSKTGNEPTAVTNSRGQKRPATYHPRKPKTVFVSNGREQAKAIEVLGNLNGACPDRTMTVKQAEHVAKHLPTVPSEPEPENLPEPTTADTVSLRVGDFQNGLDDVFDGSVDLIFTDPPYVKAFLPQWSDLSALAARILKPNGMLIAYSGQTYLPEVMGRLGEHLRYWWLGAVFHGGSSEMILTEQPVRKVINLCKPLLFYVRPDFTESLVIHDAVRGEGSEKEGHAWAQGLAEAEFYIRRLCPENGLVVDPCLGGGTTGVAAVQLKRRFIGTDIDIDTFNRAKERILGHELPSRRRELVPALATR